MQFADAWQRSPDSSKFRVFALSAWFMDRKFTEMPAAGRNHWSVGPVQVKAS